MKKLIVSLLTITSVGLVVMNLYLVRRVRELNSQVVQKYSGPELVPGTAVPSIQGVDYKGRKFVFNPVGTKQSLLLVFTTTCPYCRKNWGTWESLLSVIDRDTVNIVLVPLSGEVDDAYLHAHLADRVPTLGRLDPADEAHYRMGTVPQTIVIDADGRVKKSWTGVLSSEDEQVIKNYLLRIKTAERR
jgi:hypothetical protein